MNRKSSSFVWRAVLMLVADVVGVVLLERWLLHTHTDSVFLALPLAFFLLHLTTVLVVVGTLVYFKLKQELFTKALTRLEPILQPLFSEHAYGADQLDEVRPYAAKDSRPVETLLIEFIPTVAQAGRDRLGQLAIYLGFAAKWRRMAKSRSFLKRKEAVTALGYVPLSESRETLATLLDDKEEEIGVLAARSLVRSGDPALIEKIFLLILDRPPLVRAFLAEDLKKYAVTLCAETIPRVLNDATPERAEIVLAILASWQRSLPLIGWEEFYEKSGPTNRSAVLRLFPYITNVEESGGRVVAALQDSDEQVAFTATLLATQWRIEEALPTLSHLLKGEKIELARSAARALSNLGDEGHAVLESTVIETGGAAGRIALEALEISAVEQ